jgi:DNA-binding NarL/FixJ family response regulator
MGEIWVSKRLVQWLANNCQSPEHFPDSEDSGLQLNTLTVSENKILNHLLNGESNKAIAKKLNISERTVKAHLTSIFRKTGAKDRLSLALRAFGKNLF